jgi:L-fuculose-phosphate aldolase
VEPDLLIRGLATIGGVPPSIGLADHEVRITGTETILALDALRDAIIEVGRRLHARGLITAAEGNISARVGESVLVTARGVDKGSLTRDQILRTDLAGRPTRSSLAVSSEMAMHTAIYAARSDVRAIVHAHPPTATAFAAAHQPLDQPILAEAVVLLGPVPLVPYAPPATEELGAGVARGLSAANAVLLANHGAVAVGDSLALAHQRMETLEQLARVSWLARSLGGAKPLSAKYIETLLAASGTPAAAPRR